MDLTVLLEPQLNLDRLSEVLDGMGHEGRLHTIYGWGKKTQAALFEAAKGFRPATLDFLVPPSVGAGQEVIHWGKNTLGAFTHFQKRFAKPRHEEGPLVGYNHQTMSPLTGPGYFVARAADDGELLIDYTKLPTEKVATWPPIIPNTAKLGFLVYANMIDYLRPISEHVSIGRAAKKGSMMDAWFALVREDR